MELRHIRYFAAVAEHQNVSRAAAQLHVSQPALSRQIRDLEGELGYDLFERTAKSLSLTKAGRVFLAESKAILRRVEEAIQKGKAASLESGDEIHVGYAPSPTAEFLPQILRAFQKKTGARVVLHDLTSEEMLEGLRQGKLQAALMVEQPCSVPPEVLFERLASYRTGVITAPGHKLSAKPSVGAEEVMKEPLVIYSRKEYPDYFVRLQQWLKAPVRKLKIAEECDGVLSLVAAVESERGIAVISKAVMTLAGARVIFIPLKPAPSPVYVGMCYRPKDLRSGTVKSFLEAARSVVPIKEGRL